MKFLGIAASAAALALLGAGAAGAATNLVNNGDFSLGNVGFGSDYTFSLGNTTPPAVYDIENDPINGHPAFTSYGDHTTGTGLMMVVNGSEVPDQRVWFENGISVLANTNYFFSTWISSAHPTSPAKLNFSINGSAIGSTFEASSTTGIWQQFFTTWNSGASTTANIALVNQNLAFSGNDFALDDIVLSTDRVGGVPEPASWALMILGFGAAGSVLRRRRTLVVA